METTLPGERQLPTRCRVFIRRGSGPVTRSQSDRTSIRCPAKKIRMSPHHAEGEPHGSKRLGRPHQAAECFGLSVPGPPFWVSDLARYQAASRCANSHLIKKMRQPEHLRSARDEGGISPERGARTSIGAAERRARNVHYSDWNSVRLRGFSHTPAQKGRKEK
jgi:hypothetical protein